MCDASTHLEASADIAHQPQFQNFEPSQHVALFPVQDPVHQLAALAVKEVPRSANTCRAFVEEEEQEVWEVKAGNEMWIEKYLTEYVKEQKAFLY